MPASPVVVPLMEMRPVLRSLPVGAVILIQRVGVVLVVVPLDAAVPELAAVSADEPPDGAGAGAVRVGDGGAGALATL